MKDKIDCNKINEIRKRECKHSFYTGSAKSVPTSSTQATHLRFSYKKNPMRYEAYRIGCRRDERTRQLWGEVAMTKESNK